MKNIELAPTTKNRFAVIGQALRDYSGNVYNPVGEKWQVQDVVPYGRLKWSQGYYYYDIANCLRYRADGSIGKTRRYFVVSRSGSVYPLSQFKYVVEDIPERDGNA